jgi:cytochrome P450
VRFVRRVATAAHHLGGVPVPAGATVIAHLRSASDERAAAGDLYHLAFGAGPHACPGAAVARTVAAAAVAAARRGAVLRPAGPPVPGRSTQIDSYAALPMTATAAGGTDG